MWHWPARPNVQERTGQYLRARGRGAGGVDTWRRGPPCGVPCPHPSTLWPDRLAAVGIAWADQPAFERPVLHACAGRGRSVCISVSPPFLPCPSLHAKWHCPSKPKLPPPLGPLAAHLLCCAAVLCPPTRREKMKAEKLSLEDGALMRQLLDFPGGLELHIGVGAGGLGEWGSEGRWSGCLGIGNPAGPHTSTCHSLPVVTFPVAHPAGGRGAAVGANTVDKPARFTRHESRPWPC